MAIALVLCAGIYADDDAPVEMLDSDKAPGTDTYCRCVHTPSSFKLAHGASMMQETCLLFMAHASETLFLQCFFRSSGM
jgi:hypothetical protein